MRIVSRRRVLTASVRDRREALRSRYRRSPQAAHAIHLAWTAAHAEALADPFHVTVRMSPADHRMIVSLHESVGGRNDAPTPGELLCAAVAACLDSTIRLVAVEIDATIERLAVVVTGHIDVRGSLGEGDAPVGMESIQVAVQLALAGAPAAGVVERLLATAQERSPMLRTVRSGPASLTVELDEA